MGDVVDLVLLEELGCHDPRAALDDLVDPFAVTDGLGTFAAREHGQALALMGLFVARHAHDQVCVGEGFLGLLELAHVAVRRRK